MTLLKLAAGATAHCAGSADRPDDWAGADRVWPEQLASADPPRVSAVSFVVSFRLRSRGPPTPAAHLDRRSGNDESAPGS